jgi:hypothetical protein
MMLQVGISEFQNQLTRLLDTEVMIVDKKSHKERAVLLPIDVYKKLDAFRRKASLQQPDPELETFGGILQGAKKPDTDDARYKAIMR